MSRFYVPQESVKGNKILISGKEAHHILNVMRLEKLDKVVVFDGSGREYSGFIETIGRKSLTVEVLGLRTPLSTERCKVRLIQAIPKRERMDYIVEKATELGVYSLVPVFTDRSIPRWDESKKGAAVERWRKIAKESSKQCGRVDVPAVEEIKSFYSAVEGSRLYDLSLIAALSDEALQLKKAIDGFKGGKVCVAVGPEGDFTPDELERARQARFKVVNLGSRVLKSDTAALAALAILNYEFSPR